ncbi:metal dependent phosphohydrolase [Bryocella elongata]|uniref:Metal dependent phosphohydrolase n=1 Tax=Bryocella elongata TaxID=863522 RepID=A0A1H5T0P8_9BACT|nr:HD domain-containing protein [Bryocella elongata]SEF56346.1 metal dependent phosphohydrolase [Bryocella elongata]
MSATKQVSTRPQGWRELLVQYLREQAKPVHKFSHQPRLYMLTQQIARTFAADAYDDDVVFAAVYLHDLGVFLGHRPEDPAALARWDNVRYACEQAPAVLERVGFPLEKAPAVVACIAQHLPKSEPQTLEATVLRDADILEQLGAIGILRTVTKVGCDTRFHTFEDARVSLQKALDTLPGKIRLEATRELARPKIDVMREFLGMLSTEAKEHLG